MVKTLKLFSLIAFLLVLAPRTFAQDIQKLTDKNLTAFVTTMSDMAVKHKQSKIDEQTLIFLSTHINDNARFESTIIYNIPGFPPQENMITLSKGDFIAQMQSLQKAIKNYDHEINVEKIQISDDKKTARILTNAIETGNMPLSEMGLNGEIPIKGHSNCTQDLMLNNGIIQINTATCQTNIVFAQF